MPRRTSAVLALAGLLAASSASAEPPSTVEGQLAAGAAAEQGTDWESAPANRRSGFTFGLAGGIAWGSARGYPNSFTKIGDPAYYTATSGFGSGGELWFGGALTDWFVFGLGLGGGSFSGSKLKSGGGSFVFHIEAFPLFHLGGTWQDVGLFADFGTGGATIMEGGEELSNGGGMSAAGFGVFWETWRFLGDHVASGPMIAFEYQGSEVQSRDLVLVGFRTVFYGGP